jgi:hypothetical protein
MSRKTLTILIIGALALLIFIIVVFTLLQRKPDSAANTQNQNTPSNVTPTLIRSNDGTFITPVITGSNSLMVTKTIPSTGETGISPSTTIKVEFNNFFNPDNIVFTIAPAVPFTLSSENKVLTVTFNRQLASGTTYTFKVDPKETFPRTYTFTTEGPKPSLQPNTRPEGAAQIEDDFNRTNNPDIYVATRCPYNEAAFAINKKYNDVTRKFDFVVNSKSDIPKAQEAVQAWLVSIGLSPDAISTLKITYQ